MSAWNGWYHITGSTYGNWLPGDDRGWRTRDHRTHVEGDYRHRPPPERDAGLRDHVRDNMRYPPVHLTPEQRRTGGEAVVEMLLHQQVELLCLSLDAVHLHFLARFPTFPARPQIGRAKKHAYFVLRDAGHVGDVWATRVRTLPIRDRDHQVNAYRYILEHARKGAWTWCYTKGIHWKPTIRFPS